MTRVVIPSLVSLLVATACSAGDGADSLILARDALLTRQVQVHWPSPKTIERSFEFWRNRVDPNLSLQTINADYDEPRLLVVNQFSEFPGHFVGFRDLLSSAQQYEQLVGLLRRAVAAPVVAYPPLTKLELQHDFWEVMEILLHSVLTYGSYDEAKELLSRKLELVSLLKAALKRVSLTKQEIQGLPRFNILEFLALHGYRTNGVVGRYSPGITEHERVARFRVYTDVFALDYGPSTNFFRWLKGEPQSAASATGLFVLVENMMTLDSMWKVDVTSVPKTIRTELMVGHESGFLAKSYAVFRLDADASANRLPQYRKLSDEAGGVPLADLPNAHNPYRLPLELSCFECHQGGIKIKRGSPFEMNPLHSAVQATEQLNFKERDSLFNLLRAIAPKE